MPEKLSFENWWIDFSYKFRNNKDGGLTMLNRLKMEVQSFSRDKREAFINELLQRKNLEIFACELIPMFGTKSQVGEIKKRASEIIKFERFEEILPEYLNVVIKTFSPADLQLITEYYLNYQETLSFRIPSELYVINPELFLKAFAKYLQNYSVKTLCEYDGLLYLTSNINAIKFLIDELPHNLSFKMKCFAKKKSNHSIVLRDRELSEKLLKLAQ